MRMPTIFTLACVCSIQCGGLTKTALAEQELERNVDLNQERDDKLRNNFEAEELVPNRELIAFVDRNIALICNLLAPGLDVVGGTAVGADIS